MSLVRPTTVVVAVVMAGSVRVDPAWGQSASAGRAGRLVGNVGLVGEAYTASGISSRRDATSGMVFGRAASNSSELSYGFQFMLATEQSGSRQAMNRFSVNAGYQFAGITLGDLSPVLSKFSVNGATVRGGAAEVSFGPYLATFMYGRVRRSVDPTGSTLFGRRSFNEWLYAARIGAGKSTRSHVHLIGMVARDDAGLLSDTLRSAPAENVTITPDLGLSLLGDRLHFRATYTLAAYSADTRAGETDAGVSRMLGFFTPRVGSRVDYATDVSARLNLKTFRMRTSYERVQPGFRSLGLSQLRSDQAVLKVEPSVSLASGKANLDLRFRSSRNNLEGNRTSTLKRRFVFLQGHYRVSPHINLAAAYSNMSTRNDLDNSLTTLSVADQRNVAQTILLAPTFTVPSPSRTHVMAVNTSYQFLRDRTETSGTASPEVKFDNIAATVSYSLAFTSGFAVNATTGLVSSKTPTTDAGALSLSAGTSTSLLRNRARVGVQGGWSRNTLDISETASESLSSRQLSLRLTGTYRVPGGSTIRLTARGLRSTGDLTGSFDELQISLRVDRRF